MTISRRKFLQAGALALGGAALSHIAGGPGGAAAAPPDAARNATDAGPAVYFTRDLSAAGLRAIYARVSGNLTGRIAVKLHTGEPEGPNIIPRDWVRALLPDVPNSAIVECNVLYPSPRQTTQGHRQTLIANGWTFCPVDIMDADGDAPLPVAGGRWLRELAVGKNLLNYDSLLALTHFKGHAVGGFGGALKNIAIGCASGAVGKQQIHRRGQDGGWPGGPEFMERMAEGGKAIADHFGQRLAYINVLRNMSVDCDCAGTAAAAPTAPDIGILASTDMLAVDQASVDMVYALPDAHKKDLVERIESRSGLHQLMHMKKLGMGSDRYQLVTLQPE